MNTGFTVRINLFTDMKTKRTIPKLHKYFFLTCLFAFGFDFGFINIVNNAYRSFVKFLSTISTVVVLMLCLIPFIFFQEEPQLNYIYYLLVFLQQTTHVLCLRLSKYNLYHFIKDIYKVDKKIMIDKENKVLSIFIVYNTITYITKVFASVFNCARDKHCYLCCSSRGVFCAVIYGMDVISIVQVLIYYYMYDAVKCLTRNMDKFDTILIRKQYTDIANCSDKIHSLYGKLVSKTYSNPNVSETLEVTLFLWI